MLLDFTGYVLRWDEGIHWALVTGTNLVKSIPLLGESYCTGWWSAGTEPGPATLIRFYGLAYLWAVTGSRHPGESGTSSAYDGTAALPCPRQPCALIKPASRVSSW